MRKTMNYIKHGIAMTLIGVIPIILSLLIGEAMATYLDVTDKSAETFYIVWFITIVAPCIFLAFMLCTEYWTKEIDNEKKEN